MISLLEAVLITLVSLFNHSYHSLLLVNLANVSIVPIQKCPLGCRCGYTVCVSACVSFLASASISVICE